MDISVEQEYSGRDLWITRLYYLMMVGGGGFLSPFLNLFYVRQGLNGIQIGWVVAIGSVVSLIAAPIWTERSARSHRPRLLLGISLTLAAASTYLLSQQHIFLYIAIVAALRSLVGSGIGPISDAMAVQVTGATRSGYGSVRVWGSIGWAVIVLTGGFLTEKFGLVTGFVGLALSYLICVVLVHLLGRPRYTAPSRTPLWTGLRQISRQIIATPALVGLGLMMIVTGMANSGVGQFENVYLDQLGASAGLIGIASMVGSVVEIPSMLWSDRLVRKYNPAKVMMASLLMSGALRAFIFFFPSVGTIIAAKAVWGLSFSFYTVSLVRYIVERAAPEQTGTTLAVFTVTLASLIGIVATPIAGSLFDLLGAHWLYAISLTGYFVSWGIIRVSQARQAESDHLGLAVETEAGKI